MSIGLAVVAGGTACSGPRGSEASTSPSPTPSISPSPSDSAGSQRCARAPVYRSTGTKFGVSVSSAGTSIGQSVAERSRIFGYLPVVRQFDYLGLPPRNAWQVRAAGYGDRDVVTSFRVPPREILSGADDEALRHYFQSAPRKGGDIFWNYYHEPEVAVAAGEIYASRFVAAFQHIADIAQEACNPHLFPTLILTGFSRRPGVDLDWRQYYPGDDYVSMMAWDPYNSPIGTATSYQTPATIYSAAIEASEEAGKPWGIAETGSNLVPGDDGTGRAAWLNSVAAYLKSRGAAFVIYFQSTHGHDFELRDAPSQAAWRRWVVASP